MKCISAILVESIIVNSFADYVYEGDGTNEWR